MVLMSEHAALMEKTPAQVAEREAKQPKTQAKPPKKPPTEKKLAPASDGEDKPAQTGKTNGKTQPKPEAKTGFYWKPSESKQVKRVEILGISACAAIRGLGAKGFSLSQGIKIADHFGATLNERTVNSHIRLGKEGSDKYGAVPKLSNDQLAEAKKICGEPGVKKQVEKKTVKKVEKEKKSDSTISGASYEVQKVRQAVA